MGDRLDGAVASCAEALLDALAAALNEANAAGARAFEAGDYEDAQHHLEEASVLRGLRQRAAGLRQEWDDFRCGSSTPGDGMLLLLQRHRPLRLRPGERTPETAYTRPILSTLASLGGSGRSADVLRQVELQMRASLREVDYQATRSNPRTPRWWVTAQRARNALVAEGLMASGSPRGLWEITPAGEAWLAEPQDTPVADEVSATGGS